MKTLIEIQLKQIRDVWNNFIWDSNYCSSQIKFTEEVQKNYLMDILGYFNDTIDIVFTEPKYQNHQEKFRFTIAFLQALYVQQDLVAEMLEIFEQKTNKKDLGKDPTYSINRGIRNELIGHPLRKLNNKLISTTLYSYHADNDEIQYLRYHNEKSYNFEVKTYKISDIQLRHKEFLEKYLNIIMKELKTILHKYLNALNKLEDNLKRYDFETLLNQAELYFKSLFEIEHLYDKNSLIELHKMRHEHIRYHLYIEKFYKDLVTLMQEKTKSANDVLESKPDSSFRSNADLPEIEINIIQPTNVQMKKKQAKETYVYELSKIATNRNLTDFDFFGGLLKKRFSKNHLIVNELEHMKNNIMNELEYYTSFNLISEELGNENSIPKLKK